MYVYGELFQRIERYMRLDVDVYNGPLPMLKDSNYLTDEEVNLITSAPSRVERFDALSKIVIEKNNRGMFLCFKHSLLRQYPWIIDQIDTVFFISKMYWDHMAKTTGTSTVKVCTLQNIAWTKILNTYLAYLYGHDGDDEKLRENVEIIKHLMKFEWKTTVSFYHLQPETFKLEMEIWSDVPLPKVLTLINEKQYKIVKFVNETKLRGCHDDNLTGFLELVKKYTPYRDRLQYEALFKETVLLFFV